MEINLYENSSENYVVSKNITLKESMQNCVLKDGTSVENPVILVRNTSNISTYNYMYIPDFHRYYYIEEIVSVQNGLWELHGHVDVLQTYGNAIKGLTATCKRQENLFNMYLDDPEFKTYNEAQIVTKIFTGGNGLSKNMNYILVVSGAGGGA